MIENTYEVFSERQSFFRQLGINKEQLAELYSLKEKEKLTLAFTFVAMFFLSIGFIFFLYVAISPDGNHMVNSNIFQVSGVLCVFSGYLLYLFSIKYYDHRGILIQIKEYIHLQIEAIDQAKYVLANEEEKKIITLLEEDVSSSSEGK